jgi:S-adenosylmethionine hydrolase
MSSTRRSHKAPCVALLTDFGLRDPYVGIMKAVIMSKCPSIRTIDISHDVSPQNVCEGSYLLWSAYQYFPKGTVFLSVVDPEVGTDRAIVVLETADHVFLAPDNGLLSLVASANTRAKLIEISKAAILKYGIHPASTTFHGRDIFAPLTAALARGISPRSLGTVRPVSHAEDPFVTLSDRPRKAQVLHIDHFGNIITNIRAGSITEAKMPSLRVRAILVSQWTSTYADAVKMEPALIVGSSGLVEIVLKNGNAARQLCVATGDSVEMVWHA